MRIDCAARLRPAPLPTYLLVVAKVGVAEAEVIVDIAEHAWGKARLVLRERERE
jgi:hypothetical protein